MKTQRRPPTVSALALSFALLAGACQSSPRKKGEPQWLEAAPFLQVQIEDQAARLPWVHGVEERVELIHWFAQVGEPAYATLLELVQDPRPDVSASALAALGATRDARLVEPLRAVELPPSTTTDLELERARTLVRLGDWSQTPVLINGLRDERPMTRVLCLQTLREATHETFGFEPASTELERAEAIARWDRWWQSRAVDPLLEASF